MQTTQDTIAAISTAAGASPRAIVRLSGPEAMEIASGVFAAARPLRRVGGFGWIDGLLRLGGGVELPARAYVFVAPRSYTRQDVVELHVSGSPAAATATLAALLDGGARQADPGEFTARAFLAGRIDLVQVEAVAGLVNAASDAALRSAAGAMDGRVGRLCGEAAAEAADVLAAVEASIDLADEHLDLDDPAELAARLAGLADRLERAAAEAASLSETAAQPRVVLAGRPNVGKSSLLNALSGTDRAIISALAGTTRDVLSAPMAVGPTTVLLLDAAGFATARTSLAAAADAAARRAVSSADVVLFVADAAEGDPADAAELLEHVRGVNPPAPLVLLANKIDRLAPGPRHARLADLARATGLEPLAVSATTRQGLGELLAAVAELLEMSASRAGEAMGLGQRQRRHVLNAAEAVRAAGGLLAGSTAVADVAELAAAELRNALADLGVISGQIVTEDILGRIFERFCVGK